MRAYAKYINSIKYIYWAKRSHLYKVSRDEFKSIVDELKEQGRTFINPSTRAIDYFNYDTYSVEKKGNYLILKYVITDGDPIMYSTNYFDDSKNDTNRVKGNKAFRIFQDKFEETNGTTMIKAYGTTQEEFKRNVPKQFYFRNESNEYFYSASSIDASSQYPSGLFGDLPDSHTMIKLKGRVKPSEDYPFAFYSSGHIAEYNKYDTHDWLSSPYRYFLFREGREQFPILKEDDYTILMKPSKYHMDSVWQYFYDNRKTEESFKLVMNASIGCFHKKKYRTHKFAHLAAIAIARGNQKILEMCDKIGQDNIIQICVDGIIYKGITQYGIQDKKIGLFHQEFTDCVIRITGMNNYVVMKDLEVIKYKHAAYNCYSNGKLIDEQGVKSFKDMDKWINTYPLKEFK